MPKTKTHSGASKRFKVTASGLVKHKKANKRHLLRKKSKKAKRVLNVDALVPMCDMLRVKTMLRLSKIKRS